MIGWILLATFAVLSYAYSWWLISGVVVLVLWKLTRWSCFSSRPWRRVHFPMMRAYARACGLESAVAHNEGREFDLNAALLNLLRMVNPDVRIDHKALIEREFVRCESFYDESLIREYLARVKGKDPEHVQAILSVIKDGMKTSDKGLMVRMVIACIIEEQFSPQDRAEYLFEVFNGKAT